MTDNKTEALKLALEALEDAKKNHGLVYVTELCAIRKALADQPASKPWVGLTDEEKTEIRRETYALPLLLMEAIEAKLKEKNT